MKRVAKIASFAVALAGCSYEAPEPFVTAQILAGEEVPAQTLNSGRASYQFYCAACHGKKGDGRGASAAGLSTPPRDFRTGMFKFGGVIDGLPPDEELERLVQHGLDGTAMLAWPVPDAELHDIIDYIKTFSPEGEGWREDDFELGERIVPGDDPWQGQVEAGIERGNALYHGVAMCYQCHPAYAERRRINEYRISMNMQPLAGFRDDLWASVPKESATYSRPRPGDPECDESAGCGEDDDRVCRFGRCEEMGLLIPPDFALNPIKNAHSIDDLYKTIAAGIPGTAMPAWTYGLSEEDIWALAHFVMSVEEMSGTAELLALRARLEADSGSLSEEPAS